MTTEHEAITLQSKVRVSLPHRGDAGQHSRQVSHHPPISAYFYISPANHIRISGELKPKSKFLGNSVATVMDGENRICLTQRPDDGGTCGKRGKLDLNDILMQNTV